MTIPLETRYRRAMRWYPRSWREANEDAVTGILLDTAQEEGRDAPRTSELVDLAANGMTTRMRAILPRRVRSGVSAVSWATGTAFATLLAWTNVWWQISPNPGLMGGTSLTLFLLWAAALVSVLFRWRWATRIFLLAVIGFAVVLEAMNLAGSDNHMWDGVIPTASGLVFLALQAAGALLGTPRRRWPIVPAAVVLMVLLNAAFAIPLYVNAGLTEQATPPVWMALVYGIGDGITGFWLLLAYGVPGYGYLVPVLLSVLPLVVYLIMWFARRTSAATVVLLSSVPWYLAIWTTRSSDPSAFGVSVGTAALVIGALVVALALFLQSRADSAPTDRLVTKTPAMPGTA